MLHLNIDMIKELSDAFGPSGHEEEVCKVIKKYSEGLELSNDAMFNLYMKHKSFSGKKPVIMLDAHMDECSFMVQCILENGLLSILPLGGMHLTNLPAHTVIIRNKKGEKIRGIITSKPVHFLKEKERNSNELDIESIYVDVGASSKKEVMEDYGISLGDPMMPEVSAEYDAKHDIFFGKALDNRIGCACIIETMKELMEDELNVDVVGAFATQEEVGMRGAVITTKTVQPDLAIVFEGSPADDFYYDKTHSQGALKKGVQLRHVDKSYITDRDFINLAQETGDEHGIPYQNAVRRGGSTNAARISLEAKPIPVLVLGVPCRYVHTHYNYCSLEDVQAAVKMAGEVIRSLDQEKIDILLKKNLLK